MGWESPSTVISVNKDAILYKKLLLSQRQAGWGYHLYWTNFWGWMGQAFEHHISKRCPLTSIRGHKFYNSFWKPPLLPSSPQDVLKGSQVLSVGLLGKHVPEGLNLSVCSEGIKTQAEPELWWKQVGPLLRRCYCQPLQALPWAQSAAASPLNTAES